MKSANQIKTTTTDALLKQLENLKTEEELVTYLENLKELTFQNFIHEKIEEKGISPAALIEAAQLQRNYGYQILSGVRNPGREKVLALSLAIHLTQSETQRALSLAGVMGLYPRNRRDCVILFALQKELSVMETNELLDSLGETPLD